MSNALLIPIYVLVFLPFYIGFASWVGRLLKRRGRP